MKDYQEFLKSKSQIGGKSGFKPTFIPDYLFPFQKDLTVWAIEKGKSAIFADTGMGKTPMQLVWAQNIIKHTNKSVLILAPLAVAGQTIREAKKFDIDAKRSYYGEIDEKVRIYVTNYERLHYYDPNNFAGVVCDESSVMKNYEGKRQKIITQFMRTIPYRAWTYGYVVNVF